MEPLLHIVAKPDNMFVLVAVPGFAFLLALWLRTARAHDALLRAGGEDAVRARLDGPAPDGVAPEERVHSWPYLLRIELVTALVVLLLLTVFSIRFDAPLEQIADPTRTPNPSKAPWYFLGLQELLVYFDPWIAGVVLPVLIVVGLALIPYLDVNPRGNGYFCWRDRRFALSVFLFGFVGLWLALVIVGTFFRGPGWVWFWPWEAWDAHRAVDLPNRDWPQLFGIPPGPVAGMFGACTVGLYYASAWLVWRVRRDSPALAALGPARYAVVSFLLLTMVAVPLKMALRLVLSVKYVWTTPWFSV